MNKKKLKKTICASVAAVSLMSTLAAAHISAVEIRVSADESGATAVSVGTGCEAKVELSFPTAGFSRREEENEHGWASTSISVSEFPGNGDLNTSTAEAWVDGVMIRRAFWH
jgi:uncharacterized protein YcnI